MTVTIDRLAPVTLATADGETRTADRDPHGSWACPFCAGAVISPAGHEAGEDANAEHYAARGETYERRPYSAWDREAWQAQECRNPGCLVNMSAERLAQLRERQRADAERQRIRDDEQRRKDEAAAAAEQRLADRRELLASVRADGIQLGFAWACAREIPAQAYGEQPAVCGASGYERDEYTAHMRGHGRKSPTGTKLIRLRKGAPAARLPKLDFSPFKRATWTQTHTEPAVCSCGHLEADHRAWHGTAADRSATITYGCSECDCRSEAGRHGFQPGESIECERRGQFWALGPDAHSAWFLPIEPAPWETGRAAPVLLYQGKPGSWHTAAYSARFDRR